MHVTPILLLLIGAASVGVVHSILPDHWVPLAVVARTQRWSMARLARTTFLAASGHVLTSIALGAVIAVIGLQFQRQIETQQGHIVGGVLIITGLGFLVWGLTGHGHAHEHGFHDDESEHEPDHDHAYPSEASELAKPAASRRVLDDEVHQHVHQPAVALAGTDDHVHEHEHGGVRHSHRHQHEVFIQQRAAAIAEHSSRGNLLGHLSAIAVPFGVAASPDLSFVPIVIAASAYGTMTVGAVLGVFGAATLATFVGLTLIASGIGYQMRGEWLERNANTITSLVLIGIGVVAFAGL